VLQWCADACGAAGIAAISVTIIYIICTFCICSAVTAFIIDANCILLFNGNTISQPSTTHNALAVFTDAQRIYAAKIGGFPALIISCTHITGFVNAYMIKLWGALSHAFASRQAGIVFAMMLIAILWIIHTIAAVLTGLTLAFFIAHKKTAAWSIRSADTGLTQVIHAHSGGWIL